MHKSIKTISLILGMGTALLRPSGSYALGPIDNNLDPTFTSSQLGDQKITGIITLIETAYKCLTIDRGNGAVIRVAIDQNTQITRNGFAVDFRDLVAGNTVTVERSAGH